MPRPLRLIALCGSLRARSSNLALLRAAAFHAPPQMSVHIYDSLGELPHFNPDLDVEGAIAPPPVAALRALLASADAYVICSPEYAHGIPGSLKNALDWLVSVGELTGKPVALFNASSGGEHAQAALIEVLTTMSWPVSRAASLLAPFMRKKLEVEGPFDDPELAATLRKALDALASEVARSASTERGA